MPWKKREDFNTDEEFKEFNKKRNLWTRYKITLEDWYKKLEEQSNKCGLCKEIFTEKDILCLDHCHTSNKLRHIIHDHCNRMLGGAKDRPDLLRKGIAYLRSFLDVRPYTK